MKARMQILCALGFGLLPVIGGAQYATVFDWFIPILLGLIFFVMWRYDVSRGLLPWLFISAAVGHLVGNWFNSRHGRPGPLLDNYVWSFIVVAILTVSVLPWLDAKIAVHRSRGVIPHADR